MADSIENLWEWLIPNDMDVALKAEREANVRGIDKIEAVGANHSGPFAVIVTKYFGDNTQRSKLACDPEYNLRTFASYAEAKSWITSAKREPYSLTRHERCFPDFTIVAA
jgi:hypothetical protein